MRKVDQGSTCLETGDEEGTEDEEGAEDEEVKVEKRKGNKEENEGIDEEEEAR